MKFILCTGEFDPTDRTQLCELEEDLSLPKEMIMTAAWIKKKTNNGKCQGNLHYSESH